MKESKKAILRALSEGGKKGNRFDMLVLNLALQKVDSDSFDFDGEAVYSDDLKTVTFAGTPKHLSRHTFDDSDDLHRIVVSEKSAAYFQKSLHYDAEDDEYQIVERSNA